MKHFAPLTIAWCALGCASANPAPLHSQSDVAPVPGPGLVAPPEQPGKLAHGTPAHDPDPDDPQPDVPGSPAPPAPPSLPEELPIGEFVHLDTPEGGLEVLHAPASVRRALVYLHGACGDPRAARAFKQTLGRYATLVALYGERGCGSGHPGRFYWNGRAEPLMRRIDTALEMVSTQRDGLLDSQEPLLFGYSQGSEVAQLLAERWPERFPEVILGGVPSTPSVQSLSKVRSVAIIGGSREFLTPMRTGEWLLTHNRVRARLFVLAGAKHGSFGAHAERDLGDVFGWLLSAPEPDPAP